MLGQEADHLAAHHQIRHRQTQIQPFHTVDLQTRVTIEHIVDRDRIRSHQTRRHDRLHKQAYATQHPPQPQQPHHATTHLDGPRRSLTGAVAG
jgi:hypothetical protein